MIWVIALVVVLCGIGGSFLDATSDNSDNTVDKKRRSAQSGESFSPYKIDESKIHTPDPIEVMRKRYNVTILSEEPYLIQFDNFLSDKECEALQELGVRAGLARSTAGLERALDTSRTSQTAWLTAPELAYDVAVQRIEDKIAEVTNVPKANMEHFQVLRYDVGQYYLKHHDYIPEHQRDSCGPRLATFFLYLNDVEDGGGTLFDQINASTGGIYVTPKKGRAALWYNTVPTTGSPPWNFKQEVRTTHEATAVKKGVKWAANKWLHVGDFVNNWAKGNTM